MYRFVDEEKAAFPIATMCRVLGVSPSGYWAWTTRRPSRRALSDQRLSADIAAIHAASRGTYGVPRVHAELRFAGTRCSRKRVARLMRSAGLEGAHRRRFVRTTTRDRATAPAPDLVNRSFHASRPNELWVADITYLPTWAGFLYLAAVIDVWSRMVVGWAMAGHLRTELILDAIDMAIARRRPPAGLVHHSDQGTEGGFHRSSQHLDMEVLRWVFGNSDRRSRRCVARSGLPADRRSRGVTTAFGSGGRSREASRPRTPPPRRASHRLWGHAGSGRLAACRRSRSPRTRGAI